MRRGLRLLLLLGAWQIGTNIALAQTAPVSDAEILRLIKERIEVQHRGIGIVFGVIDRSGSRIISYGQFAKGDPRPVNGDTVYEIGSITKVFTSLLLADMVQRGEVALDDPVSKYLPPQVKVPQHDGKSITLIDLSTHTSGLPRMPTNFAPANQANPFADYTLEQMYQFLSGYTLPRKVGSQFEYSNLGAALLGVALDRKAGSDYESLVRARVTGPLGMSDTRIALTPGMQSRLAPGHDASLVPVPNWDLPAFAAAGALRSTANDLLKFIAAELEYSRSPLLPAMTNIPWCGARPAGRWTWRWAGISPSSARAR